MNTQPAIVLRGVTKRYPLHEGASLEVLAIEQLALSSGSCTVLRGRSGSGKTTLLNLVAGVAAPSTGTVQVADTDIFRLSEADRDRFRAEHIGYVFQTFNLLAALNAIENVMLAMMFADAVPKPLRRQRATELLSRLGLAERLFHRPPQLSRGEQQRVAIARALANSPPLILADEPCASLDARTASEVLATFLAICRQEKKTLLLVSHDEASLGAADQVLDMTNLNRTAVSQSTA
jgi:ABC-type lipoprotein export system ATPase subunit